VSLCSLCEGKEGAKTIYISLVSLITGIETNMLLSNLLILIVNLSLVALGCDIGSSEVTSIDWNKVGISVSHKYPGTSLFNIAAYVYI
jgi:hypothetical protein